MSDPLQLIGATLARKYTIDSVVRIEGSSVVYRATHLRSNRSVGVRVLASVSALPEKRRKAVMERLAGDHAILSDLAQIIPAAYPLRDVGTVRTPHGNVPFVVLDWPHGITLRHMVQPETSNNASFPESIDEVVAMLEPIAVALAIAHENGVVHGGITSDAVLFREDGPEGERRAVLLDFGVARVLRAADGGAEPTPADDVRALASILAQVMARACGADARLDEARTPRARGVVVPGEIEAVFAQALTPRSYASAGSLWRALRRAMGLATLRSLEETLPPESRPIASGASRSLRPIAHSTPPAAAHNRPGREPLLYGVAAFALIVVGGLTIERVRSAPGPEAATSVTAALEPACGEGMVRVGGTPVRVGREGDPDEPARDVTVHPFCIGKSAVTMRAYKACSDRGACPVAPATNEWDGIGPDDHEAFDPFCTGHESDAKGADAQGTRPVNCITWDMAKAFCAASGGARLPTEAEWEVASRATSASIAEWVSDWRAPLRGGVAIDPAGPASGDERVVRGAHAAGADPTRFGAAPTTQSHAIGFRCAKSL